MATLPSPEELGRLILDIFKQKNLRAGEMMLEGRIKTLWIENNGREDDLDSGLTWLIDNGFLEKRGLAFFLTKKGLS